jgi:hypothetical protein
MSKDTAMDMTVNKTISMPVSYIMRIEDEAEASGKKWNPTLLMLIRLGLSVREDQRILDKKRESQMNTLQGAADVNEAELRMEEFARARPLRE